MAAWISLLAGDGHRLDAWLAQPAGVPRGAVVVVQEIFGVNAHIRAVTEGWAADGYVAIAPALFDRIAPGIELGYTEADVTRGRELKAASAIDKAMTDLEAALDRALADAAAAGAAAPRAGMVGYCWGGLMTWLAAAQVDDLAAAVPYYGGGIPDHAESVPRCPVLAHFGERDHILPLERVQAFQAAQPGVEVRIHAADHGFNCDHRAAYDATAARNARAATLDFFRQHLG